MAIVTIDQLTLAASSPEGDSPENWAALGFALDEQRECQIGGVRLCFTASTSASGIVGWSLREAASTELDGLPTTISESPERPDAPAHPNGVVAIDHVVVVSPELNRTAAALAAAGLDLRRLREEPTPAGAPRQAFFRLGAQILECVQEPDEVIARAGGSDRPAIFWGLALLVDDIERAAAAFAPHVSDVRPAVQPGRRIATVRRSAGLCVPVALMSAQEVVVGGGGDSG
jgi:hypothetical protein